MLNLAGLVGDSIVDGPGIRMTVFGQGCPHRCKGCHNANTWSFEGGTRMEEQEVLRIIMSNPLAKASHFREENRLLRQQDLPGLQIC